MNTRAASDSARISDDADSIGAWAAGWLIVVIGLSAVGVIGNFAYLAADSAIAGTLMPRFTPGMAALLAGLGVAMTAGAVLVLVARRKLGFRIMLVASAAGAAANLWIGVPLPAVAFGLLGPLVTWLFLRPRWSLLV